MENQELACKITQLKDLVKENNHALIRGFNQLFMLVNELLQDCSKQPFHSQPDEAKSPKMGCQNMVGYDPLHPEFLEASKVNLRSTRREYAELNQPLSKVF